MNKVYIVMEGCKYEGCGINSVHASEEGALSTAKAIVETSNYRNYTKDAQPDSGTVYSWSDESDILIIITREVKP
jgi:hypothetical protein